VESPKRNCLPLIETNDVEFINSVNVIEKENMEIANTFNLQEVVFQDFDPYFHNRISIFPQHEGIIPITETSHANLQVTCFLQSDFKEHFQDSILKDDSKLVFNGKSISNVAINLINDLTSNEIESVCSNVDYEQWEENEKYMISKLYSFAKKSKFTTKVKSEHTKKVILAKDQKNNQYFSICEKYLAEEIKSISESEIFSDFYLDLFDSSSSHIVDSHFGNRI